MQTSPATAPAQHDRQTNIFPLPLGPFERYMLADDRPDWPMSFVIAIDVSGDLCRGAFQEALSSAVDLHRLLHCLVRARPFRSPCWIPLRGVAPWLDWQENDSDLIRPHGDRIDLSREPGLRVWVRKLPRQTRISFQFHHAATDGLGAMQFIGDLLALYGMRTLEPGQEAPQLEALDADLLADRTAARESCSRWKAIWLATREFFHLLRCVPARVALPRNEYPQIASQLPFPAFLTRTFPRDVYGQLKNLAARKLVTPNDLLLWAMFSTIREWNRRQDDAPDRQVLRIGIPVSLRTPQHDRMPAANVLSFLFLDQTAAMSDDFNGALQAIHRRTESTASGAAATGFLTGIDVGLRVPGLVPGALRLTPCFASVIVANVGDVKRQFRATFPLKQGKIVAGNIRLEALVGAACVRRNTRVAVSLGLYSGTLLVNMHCDPKCFSQAQAETLADLFAGNIRALASGMLESPNTATIAAPGGCRSAA